MSVFESKEEKYSRLLKDAEAVRREADSINTRTSMMFGIGDPYKISLAGGPYENQFRLAAAGQALTSRMGDASSAEEAFKRSETSLREFAQAVPGGDGVVSWARRTMGVPPEKAQQLDAQSVKNAKAYEPPGLMSRFFAAGGLMDVIKSNPGKAAGLGVVGAGLFSSFMGGNMSAGGIVKGLLGAAMAVAAFMIGAFTLKPELYNSIVDGLGIKDLPRAPMNQAAQTGVVAGSTQLGAGTQGLAGAIAQRDQVAAAIANPAPLNIEGSISKKVSSLTA